MITMHARPRQTDEQTVEHHGNSATIRSVNAPRANNLKSQQSRNYVIDIINTEIQFRPIGQWTKTKTKIHITMAVRVRYCS